LSFLNKFFDIVFYIIHYLILVVSLLVLCFSVWFFFKTIFHANELYILLGLVYLLICILLSLSFILHHYIVYTNKDIDMKVAMEKLTPKKALSIIKGKRYDIPMFNIASINYICYGEYYVFGKCKKAQKHKENLEAIPKNTQKVFVLFFFLSSSACLLILMSFIFLMLAPQTDKSIKTDVTPKEAKEIFCKNVSENPSYSGFKKGTIYYSTDKWYYIFTTATDNSKDIVKIGKDFPSTSMSHTVGGSTYIEDKDNIFSCNASTFSVYSQ
jgi:hypothetical protein